MTTDRLLRGCVGVLPLLLMMGAGASAPARVPSEPQVAAGQPGPTAQEAVAILQQNCWSCHSGATPMGGLRLTGRAEVLKGGASGPAVSLARTDESLLLKAINYRGRQMPPTGKLPQKQIDILTRWVKQ